MINSLLNPSKYPDCPDQIKFVQTHISYVFISKKYVYKIKKPVDFGFLDFTTLEKRKYFCEREILLNSRLSPEIYLKVVPVKKLNNEYFYNSHKGEIVDYAVVMKRIDENFLLKNLLKHSDFNKEAFYTIAEKLFEFHNTYPASKEFSEKYGSIELLKFTTDENFSQTEKYIDITIEKDVFTELKEFTNNFYIKNKKLFKDRIEKNMIKEAHGDLHLEHIGLKEDSPFFLDCIEFNERFRIIDVTNELAFLSMDLDFNGYKKFSEYFINIYKNISKDIDFDLLLNFYKVYRAYVRGKVTSFLLDDEKVPEKEKIAIKKRAHKYFNLAYSYIKEV